MYSTRQALVDGESDWIGKRNVFRFQRPSWGTPHTAHHSSLVEQRAISRLGWVGLGWCCFQGGLFVGWPKTPVSSGRCLFSFIDVVKGWRRDVRSAPAGAHRTGHERIQRERCMSASNVRADDDACRTDLLLIVFFLQREHAINNV